MHKSREGLEEEEGRLQFGALQKEGTADVLAQLGRSRGGSPGIGGWQRPPWPEPSSPQLPGRGVGSRCGEKICKRAGVNLDQSGRSPTYLIPLQPLPDGRVQLRVPGVVGGVEHVGVQVPLCFFSHGRQTGVRGLGTPRRHRVGR